MEQGNYVSNHQADFLTFLITVFISPGGFIHKWNSERQKHMVVRLQVRKGYRARGLMWKIDLETGRKKCGCSKFGRPWKQRGVNCADVIGGPDQPDNTWGAWDYQDDYVDQPWVQKEGKEDPIDLDFLISDGGDIVANGFIFDNGDPESYRSSKSGLRNGVAGTFDETDLLRRHYGAQARKFGRFRTHSWDMQMLIC